MPTRESISIHSFINTHKAATIIKYIKYTKYKEQKIYKRKKNKIKAVIRAAQIEHTINDGRSHRLLKYSQNQRFTTQLKSVEGSQCESIGLYLSNILLTFWDIQIRILDHIIGVYALSVLLLSQKLFDNVY